MLINDHNQWRFSYTVYILCQRVSFSNKTKRFEVMNYLNNFISRKKLIHTSFPSQNKLIDKLATK